MSDSEYSDDSINCLDENGKCKRCSLSCFLKYFLATLTIIFLIEVFVFYYFAFAGISYLTLYTMLYEWLSLFTKNPMDTVFSVLVNFSDFGLFFTLTLICFYIIKDFDMMLVETYKKIYDFNFFSNPGMKYVQIIFLVGIIGSIILLFFIIYKWLFYGAVVLESYFLFTILLVFLYNILLKDKIKIKFLKSTEENTDNNNNSNEMKSTDDEDTDSDDSDEKQGTDTDNMYFISSLKGMLTKREELEEIDQYLLKKKEESLKERNKRRKKVGFSKIKKEVKVKPVKILFENHQLLYRIIVCVIILLAQFYSLLYPFFTGSISISELCLFFFVKCIYIGKILCFNFIDIFFNGKRILRSLKHLKAKIVFWVVVVLYALLFIAFISVLIVSKMRVFPTIKSAKYIENSQPWYRLDNNESITPESFCFTQAQKDGSLNTVDFAMLATLPRLYGVTKYGKCYLKPSMRGLFNTTMKYIFGKDYEKDRIYILCKSLTHYPMLIISSEKILNHTLEKFPRDKIQFLGMQFDNIKNTNYFEGFQIDKLPNEGKQLYESYDQCVQINGSVNCEEEWESFTQYYWPTMFTDDYVDIKGFERYQIFVDPRTVIQPSFITEEGKLWAGTHYVVGGSYEDTWGIGFFIETIGRNYAPDILENFLPMYNMVQNLASEVFLRIEWFNRHLLYFDVSSSKEMESIADLYKKFNFTNQALFSIGHSITGTAIKGVSLLTDIQGIVFEASNSQNNVNFLKNSGLEKSGETDSQITNIYSAGTIFTGNDESCDVNGVLPKRYKLPNVYATACLTAISCSNTMKYVPFCHQTLAQNNKDPIKEFNLSFEAYLQHYGYI